VNAAELPAPQLGRILIAAGLLSEEQLAQALEEQAQTGRRLGEVIVRRGFISGPALANALAEQHGGVLKTEYGFASGLGGIVARRAAAESGTSVSPLRPPEPTPMPALRTAEPEAVSLAPEEGQAPTASEELAQPLLQPEAPEALTAPEPPAEPEQTLEPPPLLRPAEPPAPAFEKPAEPEPPPAAVSPLSPPEPPAPAPPEPSFPPAEPTEVTEPVELRPPDPAPVQEVPHVFAPEPEVVPPPEPEPTPLAEAAEPVPEPVDLRPPAPEPQEAPQPVASEPEFLRPPEPEPTPPAEAVEPIPEPVEPRPPVPEPVQEAEPVVPEPVGLPGSHEPEPEQPAAAGLDDRDELIESLRARVEAQELELAKLREQLEQERTRKDVQVHVWPEEQPVPTTPGPVQAENYLLCVPTAAGYVLLDRVGGLPSVGQAVEVPEEEGRFTVTKVVRLPRNGRPCAYLQRA
jgi:hypothetical protein